MTTHMVGGDPCQNPFCVVCLAAERIPSQEELRDLLVSMRALLMDLRLCEGVQSWYDGTRMIEDIDAVLDRTAPFA